MLLFVLYWIVVGMIAHLLDIYRPKLEGESIFPLGRAVLFGPVALFSVLLLYFGAGKDED
jgi:hypothetical protein